LREPYLVNEPVSVPGFERRRGFSLGRCFQGIILNTFVDKLHTPIMICAKQSDPYLNRQMLRAFSRCKFRNTQRFKPGVVEAAGAIVMMPWRSGESINGRRKTLLN